jgi:hypothetical protein
MTSGLHDTHVVGDLHQRLGIYRFTSTHFYYRHSVNQTILVQYRDGDEFSDTIVALPTVVRVLESSEGRLVQASVPILLVGVSGHIPVQVDACDTTSVSRRNEPYCPIAHQLSGRIIFPRITLVKDGGCDWERCLQTFVPERVTVVSHGGIGLEWSFEEPYSFRRVHVDQNAIVGTGGVGTFIEYRHHAILLYHHVTVYRFGCS